MKKVLRNELIESLENEVDRQLNVVVNQFQNLSKDQLNRSENNGGWGIVQNLEHLNLYFNYYNPAIIKALDNAEEDIAAGVFKSGWLGNYFSNAMDYRNNKKIKAFKDYIPSKTLNPHKVVIDFIQNEEDFLKLIRRANNYNLTKIRLSISLTKWVTMRLGDVFQFVTLHNERHIVQAQSRLQ
jgi:hypothetical protein